MVGYECLAAFGRLLMATGTPVAEAAAMGSSRRSSDIAHESDAVLVERARSGERIAFGLLYLRHHEAAWRVANAVTAFSSEAGGVVVEAFTRVLTCPPHRLEGDALLRPDLLVCVREVALERAADSSRVSSPASSSEGPGRPPREIVLEEAEPVIAEAFRDLEEPERTAFWLTEIEVYTPAEVGTIMGLPPERAGALALKARHDLCRALARLFVRGGTGSCREAAPHVAGVCDDDTTVRADLAQHLARCPICRMRQAEAVDLRGALRCAIPPLPLLGRPCQRRWLGRRRQVKRHGVALKWPVLGMLATGLLALLFCRWPLPGR